MKNQLLSREPESRSLEDFVVSYVHTGTYIVNKMLSNELINELWLIKLKIEIKNC